MDQRLIRKRPHEDCEHIAARYPNPGFESAADGGQSSNVAQLWFTEGNTCTERANTSGGFQFGRTGKCLSS